MNLIHCEIYLNVDKTDPTTKLLQFIDSNINVINKKFYVNFNLLRNKDPSIKQLISDLTPYGIKGLPCMLCYKQDQIINAITGSPDICDALVKHSGLSPSKSKSYFIQDGKLRSSGLSEEFDEDAYRSALNEMIKCKGENDDDDEDSSNRDMEKVKQAMTGSGINDSEFQKAIARAKVGGKSFGNIAQERRTRTQSKHSSAMRGSRITEGRSSSKNRPPPINNMQSSDGAAYRGGDSERSIPLGKKSKIGVDYDYDQKPESLIIEESEKSYDKSVGIPIRGKTTGSNLLSRLQNSRDS
jgi:hypothetical protein